MVLKKKVFSVFLLWAFLFLVNYTSADFIDSGDLVQNVTDCGVLNTTNATYTLNQSLNSSFDCITINATNITLNCADYNITFGNATGGFGVIVGEREGMGFNDVTIRNCYLMQNESGVNDSALFVGSNSENIVIFNNTIENYGEETLGVMIGDGSINANISSNRIYTNGTGNAGGSASGIIISDNGTNAVIEDNLMAIVGDDNSGLFLMGGVSETTIYNNIIWIMGNRTISDHAMGGVVLDETTYNLNVSSNLIISGGSLSLIEQETEEEVDLTLENWTKAGGGYDTAGIWIWGDNSSIYGNTLVSFGDLGKGLFLSDVGNLTVDSNFIITLGDNGYGISSTMSEETLTFYGNIIATSGENASAIHLVQDSNNNISSNDIATFGNYSYGIFFNESHNHTLVNNLFYTDEETSYILYLITSAGELIYDNLFNTSTNGSGIYIADSDPSDFNTTKTSGTNIVGKSYIGGNFYTNSLGNGYSDTCTESDGDYICDSSYRVVEGVDVFDYLPLTLSTSYVVEDDDPPNNGGSSGCTTEWVCTEWGSCIEGVQIRNCTKERPYCYANIMKKPAETQNCSIGSEIVEDSFNSPLEKDEANEEEDVTSLLKIILPLVVVFVLGFIIYNYYWKKRK
ncbi:MAG: NosD domain-containing protein [Candidatus Pacearchaeota archaeon]